MEELDNKIYRYGMLFYSFNELYSIYNSLNMEKKKIFKDCLAHYSLIQILEKSGNTKYTSYIEMIAGLEKKRIDNLFNKKELLTYNKEYLLKVKKLVSLFSKSTDGKLNEFVNGEWLLNKLVSLTLGSSYKKDELNDFSIIKYDLLTNEECMAITDNFIKNMNDEEIKFYGERNRLRK